MAERRRTPGSFSIPKLSPILSIDDDSPSDSEESTIGCFHTPKKHIYKIDTTSPETPNLRRALFAGSKFLSKRKLSHSKSTEKRLKIDTPNFPIQLFESPKNKKLPPGSNQKCFVKSKKCFVESEKFLSAEGSVRSFGIPGTPPVAEGVPEIKIEDFESPLKIKTISSFNSDIVLHMSRDTSQIFNSTKKFIKNKNLFSRSSKDASFLTLSSTCTKKKAIFEATPPKLPLRTEEPNLVKFTPPREILPTCPEKLTVSNSPEKMLSQWFTPASQIIELENEADQGSSIAIFGSPVATPEALVPNRVILDFDTPIKAHSPNIEHDETPEKFVKTCYSTPRKDIPIGAFESPKDMFSEAPSPLAIHISPDNTEAKSPSHAFPAKRKICDFDTPVKSKNSEATSLEISELNIDNESFSVICQRLTEPQEEVVYLDKKKRRPKPGSLTEKATKLALKIDTSYTLFDYELKSGLRKSDRSVSSPMTIAQAFYQDEVHYLICDVGSKEKLIVVANCLKGHVTPGRCVQVHFPVPILTNPSLGSTFIFAGNQIEFSTININPRSILYCEDSVIYRTLNVNFLTILDLAAGQKMLPETTLKLTVLHTVPLTGFILMTDNKGEFCLFYNKEKAKCIKESSSVALRGFCILKKIIVDQSLSSLLQYCGSFAPEVYLIEPFEKNWDFKVVCERESVKALSSLDLILKDADNIKRYKICVRLLLDNGMVFAIDKYSKEKVKISGRTFNTETKLKVFDGVVYNNGSLCVDEYTKIY